MSNYCFACGRPVDPRAEICPGCGIRQRGVGGGAPKSRTTAIVLALFLGGFGAHKFYLGQPGMGILYLVFCWTFIPVFISLIEIILYLLTSDKAFAAKYS